MDTPITTTTQPPQQPPITTATLTIPPPYIDSTTSSPHSRANDFDDSHAPPQQQPTTPKIRLMCSYNGHIVPHPHTKSLIYVGGETRMIAIDRSTSLSELSNRLSKTLIQKPFVIKYQLPNEDLDSLITVSNDEDLDNMIEEYDRISVKSSGGGRRVRVFLFRVDKIDGSQSMGPILDGSDDWFLNSLNCGGVEINRGFSDPNGVNCLLGFDYDGNDFVNPNSNYDTSNNNSNSNSNNNISNLGEKVENQSSVPDSTTSSFGSMSSTPTLGNLPQIKVGNGGIEEQFGQVSVGNGGQVNKVSDEGIAVISSPLSVAAVENRVYLDGEKSDNGASVEFSKQQLVDTKQEMEKVVVSSQNSKQLAGELPSPDSISSDTSQSGAIVRKMPVIYQDPNAQLSSESNRFPPGIPVQQNSETGYPFLPQYNLQQQQTVQQVHQQRMHQQPQMLQLQTQPQPQAQQQYIPAGTHFVTHHPPGAIPMPAYYPIYPHQQPHHHPNPYPMYFVPAQGYSLPSHQHPNMGEALTSVPSNHTPGPPNPAIIPSNAYNPARNLNMETPKSEMGPGVYFVPVQSYGLPAQQNTADALTSTPADSTMAPLNPTIINTSAYNPTGNINMDSPKSEMGLVYRTTTGSQSQSHSQQQPQFVGYPHMHNQTQGVAPNLGTIPGYVYEFANPARPEMYYAQPQGPALGTQYQGLTSVGPTMMIPESASHVSNDSGKQQI